MARTIGRKFKNQIVRIVARGLNEGMTGAEIQDLVVKELPAEAWNTWEMAQQEIERITDDELYKRANAKAVA